MGWGRWAAEEYTDWGGVGRRFPSTGRPCLWRVTRSPAWGLRCRRGARPPGGQLHVAQAAWCPRAGLAPRIAMADARKTAEAVGCWPWSGCGCWEPPGEQPRCRHGNRTPGAEGARSDRSPRWVRELVAVARQRPPPPGGDHLRAPICSSFLSAVPAGGGRVRGLGLSA